MKKVYILMLLVSVLLAACSVDQAGKTATSASPARNRLNADYDDAAPILTQLALGTINLENTPDAVSAEQADELLFLWQAANSLYISSTTADAEKEALLNQIQDSMSTEQIDAIREMKITNESVSQSLQAMGPSARGTPAAGANNIRPNGGGFPQGGFIMGGGPPGEFGGGPGQNMQQGQMATFQAMNQSGDQNSSFMNQVLIRRVIQVIQTKTTGGASSTQTP